MEGDDVPARGQGPDFFQGLHGGIPGRDLLAGPRSFPNIVYKRRLPPEVRGCRPLRGRAVLEWSIPARENHEAMHYGTCIHNTRPRPPPCKRPGPGPASSFRPVPARPRSLGPDAEVKVWVRLKDKGPACPPFAPAASARASQPTRTFPCTSPTWRPWPPRASPVTPVSNGRTWSPAASTGPACRASMALGFVADGRRAAPQGRRPAPPGPRRPGSPPSWPKALRGAADHPRSRRLPGPGRHPGHHQGPAVDGPGGHASPARACASRSWTRTSIWAMRPSTASGRRTASRINGTSSATSAQAVTDDFGDSHGAECLSLIGGSLPGKIVASAPEAEFLLYRTEDFGPGTLRRGGLPGRRHRAGRGFRGPGDQHQRGLPHRVRRHRGHPPRARWTAAPAPPPWRPWAPPGAMSWWSPPWAIWTAPRAGRPPCRSLPTPTASWPWA